MVASTQIGSITTLTMTVTDRSNTAKFSQYWFTTKIEARWKKQLKLKVSDKPRNTRTPIKILT